jgi:transcriptional regulator with XRE-family HTH domain
MARHLFPLSDDVSKMLSFLELLIVARKIGIREFERRAKMSAGTLARLFSGKITLKFQTVLDMLEVLDVPPAETEGKALLQQVVDDGPPGEKMPLGRGQVLPPPLARAKARKEGRGSRPVLL